jgi:hypothetical protein
LFFKSVRGVVKVSRARYEAWMAEVISAQADLRAAADSSSR